MSMKRSTSERIRPNSSRKQLFGTTSTTKPIRQVQSFRNSASASSSTTTTSTAVSSTTSLKGKSKSTSFLTDIPVDNNTTNTTALQRKPALSYSKKVFPITTSQYEDGDDDDSDNDMEAQIAMTFKRGNSSQGSSRAMTARTFCDDDYDSEEEYYRQKQLATMIKKPPVELSIQQKSQKWMKKNRFQIEMLSSLKTRLLDIQQQCKTDLKVFRRQILELKCIITKHKETRKVRRYKF